jgi:signal transduction histidine kinase
LKIRNWLILSIAGLLAIAVAVGVVAYFSGQQFERSMQMNQAAANISRGINDVNLLANDYIIFQKERAPVQWAAKRELLNQQIGGLYGLTAEASLEVGNIQRAYASADAIIVDMIAAVKANPDSVLITQTLALMGNDLSVEIQSMMISANRLSDITSKDMAAAFNTYNYFTLASIVTITLGVAAIFAAIFIAVIGPIRRLKQGVQEVGAGNLEYRLNSRSGSEMGDLSRAFDAMTQKLKELTVSRDDLAEEVAARQRAEAELKGYVAKLEQSNQDLAQFAYLASHDLQEPLRMVSNYVQLLRKEYQGKLGPDADEYIGYAVTGARRMYELINGLLEYSRISSKGGEMRPVDGEALLNGALANLGAAIEESHAEITHDPMPAITADGVQIGQVFQNLIGNAIKFHADGKSPRIHIGVKKQNGQWFFTVQDNGIGIAPEFREKIFVLFCRLHSREEYLGTGIGLPLCKKMVERHGGKIWVESAPGQGSTFHFTLPVL